jgi:hypothetical protein
LIVQLAPVLKLLPQLFVCEKSPLAVMLEMVSEALPVSVTVTVWSALVVPTFCGPNVRLSRERLTEGPAPPGEILATNASNSPPP